MQLPYTQFPLDALMVAQSSLGATLTAILWAKPLRPWPATVLLACGIWLAVCMPIEPTVLRGLGVEIGPDHFVKALKFSSMLALIAMVVATPRWIAVFALFGKYWLNQACDTVLMSDNELASLHLFGFGILIGVHQLAAPRPFVDLASLRGPYVPPRVSRGMQDAAIFVLGTALAALVGTYVLDRFINSGDEWANTYQADLFAHLKTYAIPPACPSIHQNYWVFFYMGRAFAQYTPGWPLVMAPFQALGITWLAAPVMLGLTAVACARLARRCAAVTGDVVRDERTANAAGWLAALMSMLGVSMLLNSASRFPHTMVCACFAWSIESLLSMSGARVPGASVTTAWASRVTPGAQWLWGLVLGTTTSLMIAARPGDGVAIGLGIFVYLVYSVLQLRVGWRSLLAMSLAFGFFAALSLYIMHQQLGEWLKTGYSIAEQYWSFGKAKMSWPKPNEYKFGVPIGTGAYCWWPCAPALGAGGLIMALRGRGRGAALMLGSGALLVTLLYFLLEFGRYTDSGYGPRFYLPLVVPMAVGGGVLVAPLWAAARAHSSLRTAFSVGGPAVVASIALLFGAIRIAPYVYPMARTEMYKRSAPMRAIEREKIHHAVVTVNWGDVTFDPLDLAQNYPSDPDPDVVIVVARRGPAETCARELYRDRYWYKAMGLEEATLLPYDKAP